MSDQPNAPHHVRRVVLPSGKTIEVVYFGEERPARASTPASDLHVCEVCSSELVHPVEWDEAGPSHWEVTLRCPNCETLSEGVFAQELVDQFDEELDRGTESLVTDLRRLMHANMEDEIERFVAALQEDHVLPMDF